ncbi:PPE13 domain protein [Mycobacterium avium subsp. avium 2285 (R)]|nr:PPE13 domain protein [Mycobacterium avium subsp. avium 2285 (R)]
MSGAPGAAPMTAATTGSTGSSSGVPVTAMAVGDKKPEGEDRATRAEVVRSRPKVVPRNRPG